METVTATQSFRFGPSLERSEQPCRRNHVSLKKLVLNIQRIKTIAFQVSKIGLEAPHFFRLFCSGNGKPYFWQLTANPHFRLSVQSPHCH